MRKFSDSSLFLLPLTLGLIALVMGACASIGRPTGGPKDETPPEYVHSNPSPGQLNVDRQHIEVVFDENIKLDNPSQKIIVSPVQTQQPGISSNGKHVTITLKDSLIPNTTYTIDFGDAIQDLNEGNLLDGFALDFSTGGTIDSLRISGKLFEARNLEPAQSILVGVYSNLEDSAIRTLPMERIARTNQYGEFTIRNLKEGQYRVVAINDLNRDYHWDRSEDVAFYDVFVTPSVRNIEVTDTFRSSTGEADSLAVRPGIQFLPNDILLTWFNEDYKPMYIMESARPERRKMQMILSVPSDTFPEITISYGPLKDVPLDSVALRASSVTRDTLTYWIHHPFLLENDTLIASVRYLKTDTLDQLSWTTDTLRFNYRDPNRNKKDKDKEKAKPVRLDSLGDTIPEPPERLTINPLYRSSQELNRPLLFDISEPIVSLDSLAVRLEMQEDTLWVEVPHTGLRRDSIAPLTRVVLESSKGWLPGTKYRMQVDSAAVWGLYELHNNTFTHEFTTKKEEDYAAVTFVVEELADSAVVELLSNSDKVIATAPVIDHKAVFKYVPPGTIYARLFIDSNGDGEWTTGSIAEWRQPEEIYYYPKKMTLKQNWEIEQSWSIYETPLDLQKPLEIKKNKPKLKPGQKEKKTQDDEEEDEDDYFNNQFQGSSTNQYDRYRNNGNVPGGRMR